MNENGDIYEINGSESFNNLKMYNLFSILYEIKNITIYHTHGKSSFLSIYM